MPTTTLSPPESGYIVFPDTHGQYDRVATALDFYDLDKVQTVFLGDYVDFGPQIPKLVGLVRSVGAIALVGNHEWILRNSLAHPTHRLSVHWRDHEWRKYEGGTVEQYGIPRTDDWLLNSLRLKEVLEENGDWDFFTGLEPFFESDNFIAVHAGPLERFPWSVQATQLARRANWHNRLSYPAPPQIFDFKLADANEHAWSVKGKKFIKGHQHYHTPSGPRSKNRAYLAPDRRIGKTAVRLASALRHGEPLFVWESESDSIRAFPPE